MLGCTCMAPVSPDIAERVSVSVCRVHAHRLQDRGSAARIACTPQRRRLPQPKPDNLTTVGALVAGQGNVDLGGDCEVCVIAQEAAEETR